jgi:hypothetical protein
MNRSPAAVALVLLGATFPLFLQATPRALIVTGLSGSSQNADEFQALAATTKAALVKRGIPADRVEILGGKASRAAILEKIRAATDTGASDEYWLVLYGLSGRAKEGEPAFQISGPRLTATDLKTALAAIPARQFVFIGTNDAGDYLPILRGPRLSALAATAPGEGDRPRMPAAWAETLTRNPSSDFLTIAARAAAAVSEEYTRSQLAQIEHGRLVDPASADILEPPFGVDLNAVHDAPAPESPPAGRLIGAAEIDVRIQNPKAEWEHQAATAETRKMVADARAVPNPENHAALVLAQRIGFTVEDDRTTDRSEFYRVFIVRNEAVEQWANWFLPQNPPGITSKLEVARVIQPDGSVTAFNPAKLPQATDPTSGTCTAMAQVFLPGARAGCVVEVGFRTRQLLNATLPHVSEWFPVQQSAPALATELEIRVPEKPSFRVALNNDPANPEIASDNGRRIYRWKLGPLAALDVLPGDPPPQLWLTSVGISSLPSWEDFAAWYRRLAQGSDKVDDAVKKTAAELAAGARSRLEIIQRDFEFVSSLRYVAIELGVQGFRPRTPAEVLANRFGDCKDKANLIVALLRCQGIDARFVLLNRGSVTDVNFPSWQFNHAIAHVPASTKDGQPADLWLDSTDSVTPFGFVPPGDFGRAGLVFTKDSAEFKTVGSDAGTLSEIHDEWTLQQTLDGEWTGQFLRTVTGFAEDAVRRTFRGLAPTQRDATIYHLLAGLWPDADFSKPEVSDVSALGGEMKIHATLSAPGGDLPRIETPGFEYFSAPSRNRPVWMNDAQPLAVTQSLVLRFSGSPPKSLPAPWSADAAGQKLRVTWEKVDDHTLRRTARVELMKPVVPASDYAALRQAIRGWQHALKTPRPLL